jgi:hypothetical protein
VVSPLLATSSWPYKAGRNVKTSDVLDKDEIICLTIRSSVYLAK